MKEQGGLAKPYRHEQKYYISQADYELLSRKLTLTLARDAYAGQHGRYFIRSLYFDDFEDNALREKLAGNDGRDKFRIRIYNLSDKAIKLECKHKENQYIQKRSLSLSRAECDAILAGNYGVLLRREEPFAQRMYVEFRTRGLKPKVLVDYWREAYTFPLEDVRITFDMDIRTAHRATALFARDLPTYPALADPYGMVMEVKFNAYLPGHIRALIQPAASSRSAISKYVLARRLEF